MRTEIARNDVRDAILDAADRLIGLYGYRKTTVDDIAQEAGVGKGTIYIYFESKEDVALSWIDRVNCRLRERLNRIAESDVSVHEQLREMLITRVLFRFDSAGHQTKGVDELLEALRPTLLEWRCRWHEAEAAIFAKVLSEGKAQRIFRFDDAYSTARSLLLATNSLLPYNLSVRQLGERDQIEAEVGRIADLLLNGVLVR